jgi:hypothetical protein
LESYAHGELEVIGTYALGELNALRQQSFRRHALKGFDGEGMQARRFWKDKPVSTFK